MWKILNLLDQTVWYCIAYCKVCRTINNHTSAINTQNIHTVWTHYVSKVGFKTTLPTVVMGIDPEVLLIFYAMIICLH